MPAQVGGDYIYQPSHGNGFGHNAKGSELTAEMKELDLKPGAPVTVQAIDEETGWPIINWTDDVGIDRMTTVNDLDFDMDFQLVAGG